jgi:acetyl esterase/lipase
MPNITTDMINEELRQKSKKLRNKKKKFSLIKTKILKHLCYTLRGSHSKDIKYEQIYLDRGDNTKLRICVYSKFLNTTLVPGLLFIHGGGYTIGVPEQDNSFIESFVRETSSVVVSPEYTSSLDKPYPAAFDDCNMALNWLKDNAKKYNINDSQIIVGGNSAGGGLCASLCLYQRDKKEVSIAFQMPLYPMIDCRLTNSSTDNNAPVWDSIQNECSWKLYLGNYYNTASIPKYASPSLESEYKELPPAITYIGSIEVFLDETLNYINNLKNAGIEVKYKIFDGCFHGFDIMCPKTKVAQEARKFLIDSYKDYLTKYFKPQNK